jgi:hypothetical protein
MEVEMHYRLTAKNRRLAEGNGSVVLQTGCGRIEIIAAGGIVVLPVSCEVTLKIPDGSPYKAKAIAKFATNVIQLEPETGCIITLPSNSGILGVACEWPRPIK